MYQILIADDESEIRSLLRLYLENAGYGVLEAKNGTEVLDLIRKDQVDLCILDIMMPELDGFHVMRKIREKSALPVIILSAKDQDSDKILGLDLGADDYIVKPFNPLEVIARVNSNIRRVRMMGGAEGKTGTPKLEAGDLVLDPDTCTLTRGGEPIALTSAELKIMMMFMENPRKVFTKQQIYECGWGEEYFASDNSVMVCISRLRDKLSEDPYRYISTIRGLGYRLEVPEE
ncbi:MAG: response regulator transcription factor [Bilifractor sp.]